MINECICLKGIKYTKHNKVSHYGGRQDATAVRTCRILSIFVEVKFVQFHICFVYGITEILNTMVKEKPNSTRIYDEEGYRRRAACICVKSELEKEVCSRRLIIVAQILRYIVY